MTRSIMNFIEDGDLSSGDENALPRAAERDLNVVFEYFAARGTGRAMGMSTKGVIMMESRNLMRLFRDAGNFSEHANS